MTWVPAGRLHDIPVEGAVAILLPDGRQIAVFRSHEDEVWAVGNQDPFSGANVISRGIMGTLDDRPTVTSPMHKHVFDLTTGACVSENGPGLGAFPAVVRAGLVSVRPGPD